MTKDHLQKGPESPEEVDPLSATAMFLRTFDRNAAAKGKDRPAPEMGVRADASPPPSLASEPHGASAPPPSTEAPGEFTRLFVPGAASPTIAPAPKSSGEASQTPATKPSRLQGFSTPGASDAAAADHDFTQFFKAASRPLPGSPAGQPAFAPMPLSEFSRKDASIGDGPRKTPMFEDTPPSVTSLIASLSSSQDGSAAARSNEPEPYRPEPLAAHQPQPQGTESSAQGSGGVTRLIQRLSEPAPRPVPAERPEPAAASSVPMEPGEFTRMISRAEANPAINPQNAVPAPRPAEPIAAQPRLVPAIPPVPIAPPMAAVPAPTALSAPKPPTPAAPAVVAPRTKLDAMAPMLLVINTFLLLVLLIAVLFLIKSR